MPRARVAPAAIMASGSRPYLLLAPPFCVLLMGVGLPLLLLLVCSVWTQNYLALDHTATLANYLQFFQRPLYAKLLERSLLVSFATMIATVSLAYPMAYLIAFHGGRHRTTWLMLVTVPYFTSYLLRIFAWKVILGYGGVINSGLMWLGLIDAPLGVLLYNPFAVVVALTQAWLPFVLLPIYVSLAAIDPSLCESAADLGDGPWHRFVRVVLPLSMPGVILGGLLVFIPVVGDYVTPALVGGVSGTLIGNVIQGQFGRGNNWPVGSALSIIMITATALAALALRWILARRVPA